MRAVAWSRVRTLPSGAGGLEEADQLGAATAGPGGTDAGELPAQLAGDQHAWPGQPAEAVGCETARRWRGRSARSCCWIRISAAASLAGSWRWALVTSTRSSSTIVTSKLLQASHVDLHRLAQPALRAPRVVVVVQQDVVEEPVPDVVDERLEVLGRGVEAGLARLRRHVADVDPDPVRRRHGVADVADQQVRQHARVEAAGADDHQVRLEDPLDRLGVGPHVGGLDRDVGDRLVRGADGGLALQAPARLEGRRQVERHARGRQDLAAHRQDAVRLAHRLLEVAGDRGHGGDEQVPEGVVVEPGAGREAVLHELGHERLGVGQGGDAVADVPGRRDPELLAQAAAAAPVVGQGDDGGDVGRVALQAAQQRREARSRRRSPRSAGRAPGSAWCRAPRAPSRRASRTARRCCASGPTRRPR